MTETLQISKKYIINATKDELIERLTDECYGWIFEEDSEVQQAFNNKLAERIEQKLTDATSKEQLLDKVIDIVADKVFDEVISHIDSAVVKEVSNRLISTVGFTLTVSRKEQ